jgi:hypothetical protein
MTVTLWLALVLQFASLALLRVFLGKTWLLRPATLLVFASVIYDGVIQVMLTFPSVAQWDSFRDGIAPQYEADAALLLAAGMLAYTAGFLVTGRGGQHSASAADVTFCTRVLDWRLLTLACIPLAVLTYEGRGYNGQAADVAGVPSSPSVAATFFVIAVTLTAVAFLLRHGPRHFAAVLVTQSLVLAAAGERIPVIAAAAALGITCARAGMRPSRRQVMAVAGVTVLVVAVLGVAKAGTGRRVFEQDTGLRARVSALGVSLTSPPLPQPDTPGILGQAGWRLDGTSFTAGILQARALGYPYLDLSAVPESVLEAVPKAVWPTKPEDTNTLDPYQAQITGFGLADMNYLEGVAGTYAGYLAPGWLVALMGLLGMVWGVAERWIFARPTPARLVLLAGSALTALEYEGGLPILLVAMRAAAVIAAAAWLAKFRWSFSLPDWLHMARQPWHHGVTVAETGSPAR